MNKVRNQIGAQLIRALHECNLADVVDPVAVNPDLELPQNENDLPRGASAQVNAFGYIAQALIELGFEAEYDFYCETGEPNTAAEMCESNSLYLQIPKKFFDDHGDRALPTPTVQRETKTYYWIDKRDEHLPELISDAEYYAETFQGWTDDAKPFITAARRLLDSLRVQGALA